MCPRPRIVIFASGNGSNAENIIASYRSQGNIEVVAIFCNNPHAGVIQRGQRLGVKVHLFNRHDLQAGQVLSQLIELGPDLIVLAGFLWLIPSEIIRSFEGRIINIHPAILPGYGGKGMYGERVHQAVIEAGEAESGITVHLVSELYDEGKIISQVRCPVTNEDTPDSLAQRVHALEYEHYPKVITEYLRVLGKL